MQQGKTLSLEQHQRVKKKINFKDARNIDIPMPERGCGPANRRRMWKLFGMIAGDKAVKLTWKATKNGEEVTGVTTIWYAVSIGEKEINKALKDVALYNDIDGEAEAVSMDRVLDY